MRRPSRPFSPLHDRHTPPNRPPLFPLAICAGAVTNVLKLGKIFPGAQGPDASPEAKARGAKNLGRGLLLAVVAAFLGCAVVYTIPDAIVSAAGRSMPLWFYENERIILTLGSAAANWIMGAFYR